MYSTDGGTNYVSAGNIADWSKVTHVKLDLGQCPKKSYSPLIVQVAGKYQKTYNCKTNRKNQQAFVDLS